MEKVVWNRCQTPLEDLHLESYATEIQEQFWDFINNVPFIRWMISKDRPLVSELPRDEQGRAIIDVTKPPILEHTEYFRQTAIEWQNTGKYTNLRPNRNPNSEFGRWLEREKNRCWDGLTDQSTGMWITGDQYFFLNYDPMQQIKTGDGGMKIRTIDFPNFWDGHFLVYHYLQASRHEGHHAAMLASRGKGKSYMGNGLLAKRFILGESRKVKKKVQCVVTAADKKYIFGANQILNMFQGTIDFCALNTQFAAHRLTDSAQTLSWVMGYKDKSSGVRRGSENAVMGFTSGDDQSKLNGTRGVLYLIEEAGIFKDLLSLYQMIRPSVEDGNDVYGLIYMYGTAGDDMSDFTALQEIMYNPRGYNMKALNNVYDKEGQGRKEFTMFFPAYMNRSGCMDEDGNSDVTKALLEILIDRYTVKYNSTDINAITKRISQYPITPQEAIVRSHGSIFPITELNERLNHIDNNPNAYDDVYVGELVETNTGKIDFRPTASTPIREFPTKDNKVAGALEIYEMPRKDAKGEVFPDRYYLAADPYDDDASNTMSLGSILVLDTWTDKLVAEYTGRPMYANDFFEMARKMCFFWNGRLMYENNKKGMFAYFSQKNCVYKLADTPIYLKDKQLIKEIGYGNKSKGIPMYSAAGKGGLRDYGFRLIRDWLITPVTVIEKDAEGNDIEVQIPNLYNIRNRALLKELILYNPQINVDRIMALVQLMLYREEKMILFQGQMGEREQALSAIEKDEYWDKNYPGRPSDRWQ